MPQRLNLINDASPIQDVQSFLISALTHLEPGIRKKKYPQEGYRNLIYVDQSPAAFSEFIARRMSDRRGSGKWSGTGDNTAPTVDVSYAGVGVPVYMRELGVRWNTIELIQASMNAAAGGGLNLKGDRMEAVQDIYEQEKNIICLFGNEEKKMEGFLNSPAVDVLNASMSIRNLLELITFENGIQFVINYFLEYVLKIQITDTNTIVTPNAILLPTTDYAYLKAARLPVNGDSVMRAVEDACGITFVSELALEKGKFKPTSNLPFTELAKNRMIVGRIRDKEVSRFILPQDITWGRPFPESDIQFKQIARMRMAGTEIAIPKGINYVDLPDYVPGTRASLQKQGLAGFDATGAPIDKDGKVTNKVDLPNKDQYSTMQKEGNPDYFLPGGGNKDKGGEGEE